LEELIVLPKPPLARVDHETGSTRFEQMPRMFVMRGQPRRNKTGKVTDPAFNNAQVYRDGETFVGDPELHRRHIEQGVLDFAQARMGKNRRTVGVIRPGAGYVPVEAPEEPPLGDELAGEAEAQG
jgi:hypothetical protein